MWSWLSWTANEDTRCGNKNGRSTTSLKLNGEVIGRCTLLRLGYALFGQALLELVYLLEIFHFLNDSFADPYE